MLIDINCVQFSRSDFHHHGFSILFDSESLLLYQNDLKCDRASGEEIRSDNIVITSNNIMQTIPFLREYNLRKKDALRYLIATVG